MDLPDDDEILARVERRGDELVEDANREILATGANTEAGRARAFTAWSIGRFAALEILVEVLNERLGKLGDEMERRTSSPREKKPGKGPR